MPDRKLLLEQLERLAIVLDELMPQCAELVRNSISLLKEQEAIIEQYHRADGFLAAHGWKWEGRQE